MIEYLDRLLVTHQGLPFDAFADALVDLTSPRRGVISREPVYKSWYDAHNYCLERNSTLFTLPTTLSGWLIVLLNSEDLDHGWQSPHEYFFAGLYRDTKVGKQIILIYVPIFI